jgi:hypothetical protein
MSHEISWRHSSTGKTVYATICSPERTYWNTDTDGPALEVLTVANWYHAAASDGNYWIAMPEVVAGGYLYMGDWPTDLTTADWYQVDVYEQAGASPDISDSSMGKILGYWNGTTLSPQAADTVQVAGTVQTATDLGLSVYQGAIWFDAAANNVETVVGTDGTPHNPVSAAAAVQTLSAATGFKIVRVKGELTVEATDSLAGCLITNWLAGLAYDELSSVYCLDGGLGLNLASLFGLGLTIAHDGSAGWLFANHCGLIEGGAQSNVYNSVFSTLLVGDHLHMYNCYATEICSIELSSLSEGHAWDALQTRGTLTLMNLAAERTVNLELAGTITLDASCTGGTLNLYGGCELVDNSGGAVTVNDYRYYSTEQIQTMDTSIAAILVKAATTVAISAAQAAAVAQGKLALQTHYRFVQSITSTSTANLGAATKIWATLKRHAKDADSAALLFWEKTAGLTVVNGAAHTTIANGAIAVTGSAGAWVITLTVNEAVTALLDASVGVNIVAEVKALVAGLPLDVWSGMAALSMGVVQVAA